MDEIRFKEWKYTGPNKKEKILLIEILADNVYKVYFPWGIEIRHGLEYTVAQNSIREIAAYHRLNNPKTENIETSTKKLPYWRHDPKYKKPKQ